MSECVYCERHTEWLELATYHFFCNIECRSFFLEAKQDKCSQEDVIHTTRTIRKMPRNMVCPIKGNQRCHILGLNAVKLIFNAYGYHCERLDKKSLKQLVIDVNALENLVCCTPSENVKDKYTEELFLDVFLHKRRSYESLTKEALAMYTMMQRIFLRVQEHLGKEARSPVIDTILADFALIARKQ